MFDLHASKRLKIEPQCVLGGARAQGDFLPSLLLILYVCTRVCVCLHVWGPCDNHTRLEPCRAVRASILLTRSGWCQVTPDSVVVCSSCSVPEMGAEDPRGGQQGSEALHRHWIFCSGFRKGNRPVSALLVSWRRGSQGRLWV